MPNRPLFSAVEKSSMQAASLIGHTGWDNNPSLISLKNKIKNFGLIKTEDRCCYCGRNIHGEFRMVIDIEHILPKSVFPKQMFKGKNLSVSCKRCNMNIKKSKVDFLEGLDARHTGTPLRSKYYKIIHPNLDKYDSHLLLIAGQVGRRVMLKYSVVNGSSKGAFTYDYFKLDRLEKNNFDMAQGNQPRVEIENPELQEAFDAIAP
ncbi:HNH endonuclease [Pseudoalteromonas ruthenica]|uniref:HNH endonuclease domain-containing protein n=1 Tax=Pseudoalteromonas ruthenica TaxID=151081 RepID=UPI001108EC92|nr:HNH endonuclease domain-containing protein [Pseudoalteromonas ruthenica]TLX49158.1 HNH endonuclease [Pseudoalteromonas ruthenica]